MSTMAQTNSRMQIRNQLLMEGRFTISLWLGNNIFVRYSRNTWGRA